jgi:hypothetical protein
MRRQARNQRRADAFIRCQTRKADDVPTMSCCGRCRKPATPGGVFELACDVHFECVTE